MRNKSGSDSAHEDARLQFIAEGVNDFKKVN
jgi:hypothetical protein